MFQECVFRLEKTFLVKVFQPESVKILSYNNK